MPRVAFVPNPKPDIGIFSFGEQDRVKPKSQYEFNVANLRDPQGQVQFKGLAGNDPAIVKWIAEDPRVAGIVSNCLLLAEDLLSKRVKGDQSTGTKVESISSYVSISFRDHHGKWIAPAIAEIVANKLAETWDVAVKHCTIDGFKK